MEKTILHGRKLWVARDFYNRIVGYWDIERKVTLDIYFREVADENILDLLIAKANMSVKERRN